MPPSKQARAAQERQKDRLAVERARKAAQRKRMRWIGGIVIAVAFVVAVVIVLVIQNNNSGSKKVNVSASPTTAASASTSPTTTATVASAAGKPCVAMKGTLPKGAPAVPITPGPPPTTLQTKDIKVGTGATVPKGATKVTVNYIGVSCSTGEIFDSSWSRNQPFDADLSGGVIQGWIQGIPGMKVGGERELIIPPSLGYGDQGSPPTIAPGETLIFVVDVVSV